MLTVFRKEPAPLEVAPDLYRDWDPAPLAEFGPSEAPNPPIVRATGTVLEALKQRYLPKKARTGRARG